MIDNIFTVKLLDFPIFKKPIFSKKKIKGEELVPSVDLSKEKNSTKLKTKYLIYLVCSLIFFGSLGIYLVFSNYFSNREFSNREFSNREFSRTSFSDQAQATPKPTVKPLPTGKQIYNYSHGNDVVGPKPTQVIIDPIDPKPGSTQSFSVKIGDATPVQKANIVLKTDNQETEYPLVLTEKGVDFGIWTANWEMNDSYDYTYQIDIIIYGITETFSGGLAFR